ncbi:MAG: small multi-drug export protein [Candidatus Bipolaricaulis sp.]|nr:small multi-drug export protein [Candidatus Bipolaricaulis sp.]
MLHLLAADYRSDAQRLPRVPLGHYNSAMRAADWALCVLLSAAPISELRGGLPYAIARGADPFLAAAVAALSNLAVIPLALFLLHFAEPVLRRVHWIDRFLDWLFARTRRHGKRVERLGAAGLVLLVAVPLPGTGAWTGAVLAHLLGIPLGRAAWLLALGVIVAGVLVLLASLGVVSLLGLG